MTRKRIQKRPCIYARPPVACQMATAVTRSHCGPRHEGAIGGPDPDGAGGCYNWTPCDLHVGGHELSIREHRYLCQLSIDRLGRWMREASPHIARTRERWGRQAALALACEIRDAIRYWDGVEPEVRAIREEEQRIEAMILGVEGIT